MGHDIKVTRQVALFAMRRNSQLLPDSRIWNQSLLWAGRARSMDATYTARMASKRMATMLMILIIGLMAGPAVSL